MTGTMPERAVTSWRYPELAVRTRWAERIDPQERARLLARGIADRHTPESAVHWLVDQGEFAVAEGVLDQVVGSAEGSLATQLSSWVEQQRQTVVSGLAVRAQVLRDRAERVGAASDVDIAAIVELARVRRKDAEAELAELDELVDQTERNEIRTIDLRLQDLDRGGTDGATAAWADQVEALLSAKELPAARQMIDAGPGSSSLLPVEEPTAAWPWRTAPLEEILGWFDRTNTFVPPGLRDYVLDEPGHGLIKALRLLDRAPAEDAHAALAAAVQELVGVDGMPPQPEPNSDGSHCATLLIPDEFRLPPVEFAGRSGGLRVTVGDAEPEDDSVWLATRLLAERPGGVVVTLADLLGLLQSEKPRSGRARSTSSRRMGLIRTICRQLTVREVVSADAFVGTARPNLRHQVWWLLHAFGVSPDGVAVDTVLFESGGHPRLLVLVLDHVVEQTRKKGSLRIEPETFMELRSSAAYREAVQAELLAELDDQQIAALFTMIFFASADDLRSALDTVTADAGLELPLDHVLDVDAVIGRLRRSGYLVADPAGRIALCECGITHLLRHGDPHEIAKRALRRLAEDSRLTGAETIEAQLQLAQFRQHLVEIHLHDERDRADRAEQQLIQGSAAEKIRSDRHRREDRQQVDAWRKERVEIDLLDACQEVAGDIERWSHRVDIPVHGDGPAAVVGSRTALRIALRNIVRNAEQAVRERHGYAGGTVSVRVSVDPSGPYAVVDVEDDGRGIPIEAARQLARSEPLVSTRHDGDGEGLLGAKVLLLLFDGELAVLPDRSLTLGGAHVRLRFPVPAARPGGPDGG